MSLSAHQTLAKTMVTVALLKLASICALVVLLSGKQTVDKPFECLMDKNCFVVTYTTHLLDLDAC